MRLAGLIFGLLLLLGARAEAQCPAVATSCGGVTYDHITLGSQINLGGRPASPVAGSFDYNSGLGQPEFYNGSSWNTFAGMALQSPSAVAITGGTIAGLSSLQATTIQPGKIDMSAISGLGLTGSTQSPANAYIDLVGYLYGSNSAAALSIFNYALADQANYTGANSLSYMAVAGTIGGASFAGNRNAYSANLNLSAAPNVSDTSAKGYVLYSGLAQASVNAGGTSGSIANYQGGEFGINTITLLQSGATYHAEAVGYEAGIGVASGASVAQKIGFYSVLNAADAVRGTYDDAAFAIVANGGWAGPGWLHGIQFGASQSYWPFGSDSTLIGAVLQTYGTAGPTPVAKYGVDLRNVAFSNGGAAFISTNFSVDPYGNTAVTSLTAQEIAMGFDTNGAITLGASATAKTPYIAFQGASVTGTNVQLISNAADTLTMYGNGTHNAVLNVDGAVKAYSGYTNGAAVGLTSTATMSVGCTLTISGGIITGKTC